MIKRLRPLLATLALAVLIQTGLLLAPTAPASAAVLGGVSGEALQGGSAAVELVQHRHGHHHHYRRHHRHHGHYHHHRRHHHHHHHHRRHHHRY